MRKAVTSAIVAVTMVALAGCSSDNADDSVAAPAATLEASTSTSAGNNSASTPGTSPGGGTPITITAGDVVITANLNNSQVSKDFAATLPVTLPWFRNSGIEYISELSAPLTETGPFYTDVQPGDIVYYNPADSITIIYEETSSVPTLTEMGEITSDLSVFDKLPDTVEMRVERS
jgi:hypothetical protein